MAADKSDRLIGTVQILIYADDKCAVEAGTSGVTSADDIVKFGGIVAHMIDSLPARVARRDT